MLLLPQPIQSQADRPLTLAQVLTPGGIPGNNEALLAIVPPDTFSFESPIISHYALLTGIAGYEPFAACTETSLSFFGIRDPLHPNICKDPDQAAIALFLTYFYAIKFGFPGIERRAEQLLNRIGLDYTTTIADVSTPQGWAYRAGRRIANFTNNDGWNAMGTDNGNVVFPQRYADTTEYKAKNKGEFSAKQIPFPLRWQPLTQNVDGYGAYSTQVHVTPHIGIKAKPITMSLSKWKSIKANYPYKYPNSYRKISSQDRKTLRQKYIPEMLDMVSDAAGDNNKIFRSYWWDNKFRSVGLFGVYYTAVLNVSTIESIALAFPETLAIYDATLLAWREKRNSDLNRPEVLIKRLLKSDAIIPNTWKGLYKSPGPVSVKEWSPIIKTMPHSEFPSGSATICAGSMGVTKRLLKYKFGENFVEPPFVLQFQGGADLIPVIPIKENITIFYPSIDAGIQDCGESRVWSGLHFKPSITEAFRMGDIVAENAVKTWTDLIEGRVPAHCHWCLDKR